MKKVLFATTALVATASVAAADVRISGYGRFGLDYNSFNENNAASAGYNGVSSTTITSRLRIQFDASAETDGGVAFNARVRMQSESRDNNPALSSAPGGTGDNGFNGARFGVSYAGLTVNVGNIIGAMENAPGMYLGTRSAGTGIDGMGYANTPILASWDAYSSDGSGVNGVEALYTTGGFTGHISYSGRNDVAPGVSGEDRTAVMVTYSWNDYYGTLAYQSSNVAANDDLVFVALGGEWNQFGASIAYGDAPVGSQVTLEGHMDIGAASNILIWVADRDAPTLATDGTHFGINYQYDLGGGATFVAGYVNNANSGALGDQDQLQAGVYFSF